MEHIAIVTINTRGNTGRGKESVEDDEEEDWFARGRTIFVERGEKWLEEWRSGSDRQGDVGATGVFQNCGV